MGCDRGFIIIGHPLALGSYHNAANGYFQPVPVCWLACLADGHDDTPPIGILACYGGLDQR